MKTKILIIHGPNLNVLSQREPEIYGGLSLDEINSAIKAEARELKVDVSFFQSNTEGEIINKIHEAQKTVDAIVINPAAYTHTSLAIADAIRAVSIPTVEIHLSNLFKREKERQVSLTARSARGLICGFGYLSYLLGLRAAVSLVKEKNSKKSK